MKTKVAMIFSQFPCYDEVFILREMAALDRLLDLTIFSLKKSGKDPVSHSLSRPLLEKTIYSKFLLSSKLIAANIKYIFTSPGRYINTLFQLIWMNRGDMEFLLKTIALFPQAVFFASICRERKIEYVHGQWATYPATTAYIISRIIGIPFSFTGHAHDIYLKTAGLREKLNRAAFVITCTGDNKRYLSRLAPEVDPGKIKVVYHGLDIGIYHLKDDPGNEKDELSREGGMSFNIISVGSLFECKGFEYLIEAGRILAEEEFNFHCRIVGGGYLEEKLREMVRAKKLDEYITFTGYQAQDEMADHYRWADFFILPAVLRIHWGIPNVLLESLAVGVPVACTPLPSLPELISDPTCGFTIPEEDPRAIADLVKKVSREPELMAGYGRAGRRKIEEKWDIQKTSRKIAELFLRQDY
ncbi:MAG: glycosyltransferase family 4 protein [Candidatus Auribacterota bacterium]|nr:glycosyltransferase family 4 protein [Candidatus Auribacterota bacterium]